MKFISARAQQATEFDWVALKRAGAKRFCVSLIRFTEVFETLTEVAIDA